MSAQSVTILLPYGIFEKSNLQYKKYLDEAIEIIAKSPENKLVLCGGLTNVKTSLSEAQSLKNYMIEKLPNIENNIFLEHKSLTSPQNLMFARDVLKANEIIPSSLQIICDSIRVPKIYFFALTYFSSIPEEDIYQSLLAQFIEHRIDWTQQVKVEYQNISIIGLSLGRTVKELGTQIFSTMEEVAAARFPNLEEDIIALRKKEWQLVQK